MSGVKRYFKDEIQWIMLGLEHPKPSDFYLSVWQGTRSSVPLLIFRALLFIASFCIVIASMVLYILDGIYGYWFIYLTHWGLIAVVVATGLSTAVSARVYYYGAVSADTSLPWYVKTYWVWYNIAITLAFLITIFYWSVLYVADEELNHALDIAVHGLNSVIMVLLLFSSSNPSRLLHIYHPVLFGLGWVLFSIIFYLAGGTNPLGQPYVYMVIDWAKPGMTIGIVALTAVMLIALHLATIGLAAIRDFIASRFCRPAVINHLEEGTPLRQQPNNNTTQ